MSANCAGSVGASVAMLPHSSSSQLDLVGLAHWSEVKMVLCVFCVFGRKIWFKHTCFCEVRQGEDDELNNCK